VALTLALAACSSNAVTLAAHEDASSPAVPDASDGGSAGGDAAPPTTPTEAGSSAPSSRPKLVLTKDTATDPNSGLVWQRGELQPLFEVSPDSACAALVLDGRKGFRAPTAMELQSLLVTAPSCPMSDHDAFPGAYCDWYLSSTLVGGDPYDAMMVDFYTGVLASRGKVGRFSAYHGRCVRTTP